MAYVNVINNISGNTPISGFGNMFICDDAKADDKTIVFSDGYSLDSNISFKVVFINGHEKLTSDNLTLNGVAVVSNRYGTLIPLPVHEMIENIEGTDTTVYKSLQGNTILELYYTNDYDGNNNPAFVVIGNPIVLSSPTYTIYADGTVGGGKIGDIFSYGGDVAPYGFLLCDGSAVSRTTYSDLFSVIKTYFGEGDGSTTFNIPDGREVVLKGAGLTGHTVGNHVSSTGLSLGEFIDDRVQSHTHTFGYKSERASGTAYWYNPLGSDGTWTTNQNSGRKGDTTEVKSIGVNFIIKY